MNRQCDDCSLCCKVLVIPELDKPKDKWCPNFVSGTGCGIMMFAQGKPVKVFVTTRPVDFRKGAHSLAALAAEVLSEDPFSGVVLVFRSKRADRIKLVVWDGSGLVLVWKQLEGGAFRWPPVVDGALRLTPVEFAALFDGIDWTRVQSAKRIPRPSVPA